MNEITDQHKALIDEALWLRAASLHLIPRLSFCWLIFSVKLDLRFPYLIKDRIKAVKRIGDLLGYEGYGVALNRICDDLLRFDEVRVYGSRVHEARHRQARKSPI